MRTLIGRRVIPLVAMACVVVLRAEAAAHDQQKNLEPYLSDTAEGLVQLMRSERTSDVVRRVAMQRFVERFPERAPDALVEFLHWPSGHLNEFAGRLLFQLGRPNRHTSELIALIREGRTEHTKEEIEAYAHALAWPGNEQAVPMLQRLIDTREDTAGEARLCIARIRAVNGPDPLLQLPEYADHISFHERTIEIIRNTRWEAANRKLLEPARPTGVRWELGERTPYALAWQGNQALAEVYLAQRDAAWDDPAKHGLLSLVRLELAAVRTGDERCRERARRRFVAAVEASIDAAGALKPGATAIPDATAAAEVADADTAASLQRLLLYIERTRVENERRSKEDLRNRAQSFKCQLRMDDTGYLQRKQILHGLCVNRLPAARTILRPYLDQPQYAAFVGLALLRGGDPDGIRHLLNGLERRIGGMAGFEGEWQVLLIYTAQDLFPPNKAHAPSRETVTKAREWFDRHQNDRSLKERLESINNSPLLDSVLNDLRLWP